MKRIIAFLVIVITLLTVSALNFRTILDDTRLGLDLKGGFEIVYEIQPLEEGGSTIPAEDIVPTVRKRVDLIGVSEPEVIAEGENRVRVSLAGVTNQEEAQNVISRTATLVFKDVNDNTLMSSTVLKEGSASFCYDNNGLPAVCMVVNDTSTFLSVTTSLAEKESGQNMLIVWLDFEEGDSYEQEKEKDVPKYISAASVSQGLDSENIILQGRFTEKEARDLAGLINSGSLPVKLEEVYSNAVTAEYGINAYNQLILCWIIGVVLIGLFMIMLYGIGGVVAVISLIIYNFVFLYAFHWLGGVLTIPGVVSLVLGIGMAVDANVITFERMKDEIYKGKRLNVAKDNANTKTLWTILDGNITTLIASFLLYQYGTSSVKGFGTVQIISFFVVILITVALTRLLVNLLVESKVFDERRHWFGVRKKHIPKSLKQGRFHRDWTSKLDYVKNYRKFMLIPAIIVVIGAGVGIFRGLNLGVDFTSGSLVMVQSNPYQSLTVESVRSDFAGIELDPSSIVLAGDNNEFAKVRFAVTLNEEQVESVRATFNEKYENEPTISNISPTMGRELISNALIAVALSLLGMIIYVSIRFEFSYAISAIVALVHDAAIMFAFFAIFHIEITSEFVAAILAIIGYSLNDTIVAFDRIRELLGEKGKGNITSKKLAAIVNEALQQTTLRSLYTAVSTFLPIVIILLIGPSASHGLVLALTVGLVAGVYSSVFIAAQLWLLIKTRPSKKNDGGTRQLVRKYHEELEESTIYGIND